MSVNILIIYKVIVMIQLILNIILTLGAVGAAFFAGWTVRLTRQIMEEEKESRRGYLVPNDNPGHLRTVEVLDETPALRLNLKNHGVNPIENIEAQVFSFNSNDVEGETIGQNPLIMRIDLYAVNPIPHNGNWVIVISQQRFRELGVENFQILASSYLTMRVKYHDRVLNRNLSDSFYWRVVTGGDLFEVNINQKARIDELINVVNNQTNSES
jgi:hypothetical protein